MENSSPAQAAIKFWGTETQLNFPAEDYASELEEINNLTTEELVAQLRRMSAGFSRGGERLIRRAASLRHSFRQAYRK